MLLDRVVSASESIAATSSRTAKVRALTEVLTDATLDELPVVVGVLTGIPRQGRIGVGWATITGLDVAPAETASLALMEVDALVDQLGVTVGAGSVASRQSLLVSILSRATAAEQQFLRRLFTGELRQGALEGLMTDAVAKSAGVPARAAQTALTLLGDLGAVAILARTDGVAGLEAARLQVGRALQPMLAATSPSVAAAIAELGRSSVEWKLDGARIQIHRNADQVTVFTRNLNDVTQRLPEVVNMIRALNVTTLVADAEALAVGPDGRPARFQDTMSRIGRQDQGDEEVLSSGPELRPFLFDLLHLDGRDLIDEPLVTRLVALQAIAPELRIPGTVTDDPAIAEAVLAEALSLGHEGVMVKAAGSRYEAGRRGKAWRKVKPVHTLDLVVLGAEWGHGRRHGWLSNLHLGARADDSTPSSSGLGFVMVGKTFKGLTDELLAWQTTALLAIERERTGITVFVRPELVVEIAVDGVQRSTRYPGGVALRFARAKGYRPDRDAGTADTISSVRAMLS